MSADAVPLPRKKQNAESSRAIGKELEAWRDVIANSGRVGPGQAAAWLSDAQIFFKENGVAAFSFVTNGPLSESALDALVGEHLYLPGDAVAAFHIAMSWWAAVRGFAPWEAFYERLRSARLGVDEVALMIAIGNALGKGERLLDAKMQSHDYGKGAIGSRRHSLKDKAIDIFRSLRPSSKSDEDAIQQTIAQLRQQGHRYPPSNTSMRAWLGLGKKSKQPT